MMTFKISKRMAEVKGSRDANLASIEKSQEFASLVKFMTESSENMGFGGQMNGDQIAKLKPLVTALATKINGGSKPISKAQPSVSDILASAILMMNSGGEEQALRRARSEVELLKEKIEEMEVEKIIDSNEVETELLNRLAERLKLGEPEGESDLVEKIQKEMQGNTRLLNDIIQKFALPPTTNAGNLIDALQAQIEECIASLPFPKDTAITNKEMMESLRQELLKATSELLDTQERVKDLERQVKQKDRHIERLRKARDEMKEKLNDAAKAIRVGKKDFGEVAQVESVRAELLTTRMEKEKLARRMDKRDKKIFNLEKQVEKYSGDNDALKRENKSLKLQIGQLKEGSLSESKVVIGSPEMDELREEMAAKEQEKQKLLSLFEDLTQQFEQQTSEIEEQSKFRMTLISAIQRLAMVNRQLETHLDHAQSQYSEVMAQNESLVQKVRALERKPEKEVVDESLLNSILDAMEDASESSRKKIEDICQDKTHPVKERVVNIVKSLLEQNVETVKTDESEELQDLRMHNEDLISAVCSQLRFIEHLANSGEIQSWMFTNESLDNVRGNLLTQCARIESFLKENAIDLVQDVNLFDYLQIDTDPMHLQRNLQNYFTKYESPQTQEGKELLIMLMQAVTANQVLKKYSSEARARCVHQARELKSVRKELEIAKATAKVNYNERMREVKLQQERVRKEEDTLKDTKMKILEILKSCIASGSTNFTEVMRCIDALNTEGLPDLEEAQYTKQLEEKCIGTVRQFEQMKSEYNEMLKATKTELAALHKEMQEIEQSSAKKIAEQEDAMEKLRKEVAAKNKEVENAKASLHQTQKKYDELKQQHNSSDETFQQQLDDLRREYGGIVKSLTRKLRSVERGVEETMKSSMMEGQSHRSALKKQLSKANSELSETKAEKDTAVSNLEKQIVSLQQELSFVKDKEACQTGTIEKLQAELKEAKSKVSNMAVEQKMLKTKLIGKDEMLRREKSQYESQLKLQIFAIESDSQSKVDAIKNEYTKQIHDFMVRVCRLFEDMIDTSAPINQQAVEDLLGRVRERLSLLDNTMFAGEQAQMELQTIRQLLGAPKQMKLSAEITNLMKTIKQSASDIEALNSENKTMKKELSEARSVMNQELASREWEQWARRLYSVVAGGFFQAKRPEDIRHSIEETVFAAIGSNTVCKRLDCLRAEKKILLSGLLAAPAQDTPTSIIHVIRVLIALRRLQRLAGHICSSMSFPKVDDGPTEKAQKQQTTRAPLFRQFVLRRESPRK